ncbi:MAG TPA: oxygen-dependent coproporphyrinogen oxidase [Nannocystaceae bacterium]|nr:oxygen-dependent coproporphyrinogen oxidase [Nannocystaceae bacterium]
MTPSTSQRLRERAEAIVRETQSLICDGLAEVERDGGGVTEFASDSWTREGGGGGTSRVLANGSVFEKAGVNVSVVHGELTPAFAKDLPGSGTSFFATGVSLVIHPRNPFVPTVHANFRYLEHGDKAWFGGGADLTPYYWFEEDEQHFHGVWRGLCERHPQHLDYAQLRDECDRYFFLPHRGERRGVGGIFFDYRYADDDNADALLALVADGGRCFLDAYLPIVRKRMAKSWGDRERQWQKLRRGRYVEFNLLYDRGTVFGLKTGGRTESILMSLPPDVRWAYAEEPAPGTPEHALLERVRRPPPAA